MASYKRTYSYKKGDRPHLDEVYHIMGVIPADAYHQDDIGCLDSDIDPDNDSGESVLFLKDVKIVINIAVN